MKAPTKAQQAKIDFVNKAIDDTSVKHADQERFRTALLACIVKRGNGYGMRASAPQTQQVDAYCVWASFKVCHHAAIWGDLGAWTEGLTGRLIMMNPEERKFFDQCETYFHAVNKAQLGSRWGRRYA